MVLFLFDFVFIKGISIENLLNCAFSQKNFILFYEICHLFIFFSRLISHIFRIILRVCFKRRFQLAFHQFFPGKISEPNMISKLLGACPSEPHNWSSLYEFVHKICSFDGPPLWNFTFFYNCLFG